MAHISNTTDVALNVDEVTVKFGGLVALDNLSVEVRRGDVTGIIGPNGAGKSTLINVITGIYPATHGDVQLFGKSITGLKPYQIACHGIARTFQNSRLFHGLTVMDNVLIGMHQRTRGGILDAVLRYKRMRKRLALAVDEAYSLIESVDPSLCSRAHELVEYLPQADRRRVEVARALASSPHVLLLDEPAAGMGESDTSRFVDDMLKLHEQRSDLAILVIEHDMALMRRLPDQILVMNFGSRIAFGSYQEVSEIPSVRAAYLGTEAA